MLLSCIGNLLQSRCDPNLVLSRRSQRRLLFCSSNFLWSREARQGAQKAEHISPVLRLHVKLVVGASPPFSPSYGFLLPLADLAVPCHAAGLPGEPEGPAPAPARRTARHGSSSLPCPDRRRHALSILGYVRGRRRLCDRVRARRARAGVDMKGVSSIPAAAIIPSPLFLWRVKVILFLLWGLCCCKIGWDSVMRMSVDLRDLFLYEAFLYYNPLLLVALMIWLWGINLWVFAQSSVNYAKVFDLPQTHLSHREIWRCATWLTLIVPTSMTAYLYLYSHGEVSLAASQPVLLYAILLMILLSPFDMFYLSSRFFFLRTMWRIILPLQAITFPDFFMADIFTSMSKVFSDLERSGCRMVHRQVATIAWFEADSICGSHSVAIPLVLVLPYLCRFFQCLRQYKDTKEKTCLLNALKYSTAVPVIFLSALKYHVFPDVWISFYRPLWLISSVVNSLYSFYWDIKRDWDLSILTRIFMFKNPSAWSNLLYGRSWVFYWVLGSNLILRCTWTYKLSAHLRHNYLTVFAITALEMVRRFQWVFFRVENEWNKMTAKQNFEMSSDMLPSEADRLLDSNSHTV